jgi:hypothetical protein
MKVPPAHLRHNIESMRLFPAGMIVEHSSEFRLQKSEALGFGLRLSAFGLSSATVILLQLEAIVPL